MKIKPTFIVIAAVLAVSCVRHSSIPLSEQSNKAGQNNSSTNSLRPKLGYVPDEKTAIAIAVAVWSPVFGKEGVEAEKPITANLQNGVWVVQGRNPVPYTINGPGTFVAHIAQEDGRILGVFAYND